VKQTQTWAMHPAESQQKYFFIFILWFCKIPNFSVDHNFSQVKLFKISLNKYLLKLRRFKICWKKVSKGQENVLYGKESHCICQHQEPLLEQIYSVDKEESMPFHIQAAQKCIYITFIRTDKADFVDGKMIFLQRK
jgi:hypothetical protein